jgi:hypothetical protein
MGCSPDNPDEDDARHARIIGSQLLQWKRKKTRTSAVPIHSWAGSKSTETVGMRGILMRTGLGPEPPTRLTEHATLKSRANTVTLEPKS